MLQLDPTLDQSGEVQSRYEAERLTAASILIQAFVDFHTAKKLIKTKNITFNDYFFLPDYEKKVIREGKAAYEWFKNKPVPRKTGWTLDDCCEVLKLAPSIIRSQYTSVSAYREYTKNKNFLMNTENINGERNGRARLTEDQVREIAAKYREGGKSQEALGREYNVSQRMVSDIVNGKRWKHVA